MNRYEHIEILKTESGRRFKKTTKYPKIDRHINDIYIIGTQDDRLDNLAHKYYKDARLWWIIARTNNIGNGHLNVPVGMQLRIPTDHEAILFEFQTLNK